MRNSIQIFSSFFFSFLIIIAGAYILFGPALNEWKNLGETRVQLADRQVTIQRLKEMIQKFKEQMALFDNLSQPVGLINDALPSTLKIPELLVSLESIAGQSNVSIKRVSFTVIEPTTVQSSGGESGLTNFSATQLKKDSEPYPISIVLDASGNYLSFKSFLQGIEEELRLMDVKTFEFLPVRGADVGKKQEEAVISFNAKLTIDTYSIKKPQFTLP